MPHTRSLVPAILLFALACGSDSSGPGACTPTATRVCMAGLTFNPASLTVSTGTTVTWQNGDGVTHTTTANPGNPAGCPAQWDNTVASGATSTETFSAAATCNYYCRVHATPTAGAMRASITVQ